MKTIEDVKIHEFSAVRQLDAERKAVAKEAAAAVRAIMAKLEQADIRARSVLQNIPEGFGEMWRQESDKAHELNSACDVLLEAVCQLDEVANG